MLQAIFLWIVFAVFCVATLALSLYGFHLYVLLGLFLRDGIAKRG